MIKLKATVKPPSVVIACAAANVAQEMGIQVWITSGNDSTHKKGSRHYENAALDFLSKNLTTTDKFLFMVNIAARLGKKYQVILEDRGKPNEHIHVEKDDLT